MTGSGAIISGLHSTVPHFETVATGIQMDFDLNGNVIYYGIANPGSNITDTVWQIKKLVYSGTGNLLQVLWPNGQPTFVNAWSGRTGLTYS